MRGLLVVATCGSFDVGPERVASDEPRCAFEATSHARAVVSDYIQHVRCVPNGMLCCDVRVRRGHAGVICGRPGDIPLRLR